MAGALRGILPGILGLLDLIEGHRPAFEYDWRSRFHLPLSIVGDGMSWGECLRLTVVLAGDPSSHVGAALAGWPHPVTREWLALKALHDKFVQTKFRKPYPFLPAPWDAKPRRIGGTSLTREEVLAAIAAQRALPAASQPATVIQGG